VAAAPTQGGQDACLSVLPGGWPPEGRSDAARGHIPEQGTNWGWVAVEWAPPPRDLRRQKGQGDRVHSGQQGSSWCPLAIVSQERPLQAAGGNADPVGPAHRRPRPPTAPPTNGSAHRRPRPPMAPPTNGSAHCQSSPTHGHAHPLPRPLWSLPVHSPICLCPVQQ
jgi:hypothetical protein